ncbi:hypothetical protein CB0101_14000 [Synechococcus sp. CB0101]|uniref:hypothetical protein n=1 Tax=Synechococcus sp. CB0101 TaxID=232348 RepID=UPI0010AB0A5E|nr:hypothetical protein [Synechococcus sp. CB0101]QCH15866.1 hypothetical protein CB0101_14000 [Synechococcus sp. CB0101]
MTNKADRGLNPQTTDLPHQPVEPSDEELAVVAGGFDKDAYWQGVVGRLSDEIERETEARLIKERMYRGEYAADFDGGS